MKIIYINTNRESNDLTEPIKIKSSFKFVLNLDMYLKN